MHALKIFLPKTFVLMAILFLGGCTVRGEKMMGIPVTAVNHYGKMIGVSDYYVEGHYIGSVPGTGGGGASNCCVVVPKNPNAPFMIQVKWVTCDIRHIKFVNGLAVDTTQKCKEEEHEAKIPVNFEVNPGESGGIALHFLPGNRVEAWVSRVSPRSESYTGPAYPKDKVPASASENGRPPSKP